MIDDLDKYSFFFLAIKLHAYNIYEHTRINNINTHSKSPTVMNSEMAVLRSSIRQLSWKLEDSREKN